MTNNIQGAIMVDGMGIQGVPAPQYVPANDNDAAQVEALGKWAAAFIARDDTLPTAPRQPVTHDGEGYLPRLGEFICMYDGGKFWPHDPRPEEVNIISVAHSLSMICRYGGHCKRFYSVAEHSTLLARWLRGKYDAKTAMIGLMHDVPESLTGLGDVQRPGKPYWVTELEQRIYEVAVAPRFGLPRLIPQVVHDADRRITGDELVNLVPADWHKEYNDPLGVPIMLWTPAEAKEEFLATYEALRRQVGGA